MQNWMEASGYADEEPFVMIDWVSGRLRPLYTINISYDAGSGEVDEDENKVFNPSMLHLVLSPQQKQACEHAMSATNEVTHSNMSLPLFKSPYCYPFLFFHICYCCCLMCSFTAHSL